MSDHELVKLHQDILTISFRERLAIKKVMKDIEGLFFIDHLSLDIVDPNDTMTFLSSTPSTGFNICSTSLWKQDGSISPTHYKNKSFYWWDDTYFTLHKEKIKRLKEYRHGFSQGFMLVRKINDFYILYSFATKTNNRDIKPSILMQANDYLKIGDYYYNNLRMTYQNYCEYRVPKIQEFLPFCEGPPIAQSDRQSRTLIKLIVDNTK